MTTAPGRAARAAGREGDGAGQRSAGNGLTSGNFRRIARNGMGDPDNAYVHGMAWFEGRLYCGMTRNSFKLLRLFPPIEPPALEPWPVEVPPTIEDLDMQGQLWRWSPEEDRVELAYRSPLIPGKHGRPAPRDLGYRGMTVFQGASDPKPCLYVSTMSTVLRGCAAHVLRSEDGLNFEPACEPGIGNDRISTFRELVHFDGYLYAPPAGEGIQFNSNRTGVLMRSKDPRPGNWEVACDLGFGDPTNNGIFMMTVANGHLYAGTFNCFEGYQIWATPPCGDGPLQWRKVIDQGAFRGPSSEIAMAMAEFDGALYVGSSIQNGGYDRTNLVGPASGEIIRIWPDDTWELLVGSPKETPQGMVYPKSGLGPGFDNIFAGYTWRMCVHDGWLYVTTFDWSVFLQYAHRPSPTARRIAGAHSYEQLASVGGGFEMWRTRDGINWIPVTLNGMGNPYNYGGRTMVSTPRGLAVGTANVFGGSTPARLASRWTYVPNPDGGTEVYVGDPGHAPYPAPRPPSGAGTVVAVTGGGSALADRFVAHLLAAGHHARLLPGESGKPHPARGEGRLTIVPREPDARACFTALLTGADILVHLDAREAGIGREDLRAANVGATQDLLRAVAEVGGVRRVVLGSSVGVYAHRHDAAAWPIHEAHALYADGGDDLAEYGMSKIAAENLVSFQATMGRAQRGRPLKGPFEHVILRFAPIYGTGNTLVDWHVRQVCRQAEAGATVPSQDGDVPGEQVLHVDDAVEALTRACFDPRAAGLTVTIAGPDVASLADMTRLARIALGRATPEELIPRRSRVWSRYLQQYDLERARTKLGFRPSVPVAEGLRRIIEDTRPASPEEIRERAHAPG